jgi:rhodanese-related sulfurtransferase
MKKFLILIAALTLSLTLVGCTTEVEVPMELPEIPEVVDMTNVDEYLGRPDVQYVDLRNFDDKMSSGYIAGFEMIPFFDYLEATNALVRTDGDWTFASEDVVSQGALEGLFDSEKTIFLMCGSGTRAGFVLAALEEIGYENVINVGGIQDYSGDNKVFGDGTYNLEVQLPLPATVDMTNIDMYLGRNDVQYVDLRNFDDKMNSGYIAGFEFIPFFDYLEYSDILVRTNSWTFEAAGLVNQAALEGLFDMDKTIFLMCGSGTRAGFVKDALDSLGYTVVNVGGIGSYAGDNKVFGDGVYHLEVPAVGPYTPGTYFAVDPTTQYTATIVVGANGAIEDVVFDAMYHGTTKNTLDTAYTLGSGVTWKAEAAELAAYIVANQGWGEIILDVTDITGMNDLTVPHHAIEINHDGAVDAVAGVTIGAEGFVLAWNLAIAQATTAGTEGLVADVFTSEEWAAAHAPAFDYEDGVYFGDTADGYTAKVVVEDGFITSVYFDALRVKYTTAINYDVVIPAVLCTADDVTNGVLDLNGDACVLDAVIEAEYTEDQVEVTYTTFSTKQALQDAYTLGSGITWSVEANEMADAIVDAQQWDPAWVIILGTDGGHDKFDMTDTTTADAVGGVTIGMEGFKEAFEEAIAQAVPTPAS